MNAIFKKVEYTNNQIIEAVKHDSSWCTWNPEVTAKQLACAVDGDGLTAVQYVARWGYYPVDMLFEHLVLAEKNMRKKTCKCPDNLSSFDFSTPVEIAIRYGNLPKDTTKEMLEQTKTRHGTGWDSVITRLKFKVPDSGSNTGDSRFIVARQILEQFPELLARLHPLKREYDAQMLGGRWGSKFFSTSCRMSPNILNLEQILMFLLQAPPKPALDFLTKNCSKSEQIRLLKLLLREWLPPVAGIDKVTVRENQMLEADSERI